MSHSPYSPSGYDRWSTCTASVTAIEEDRRDGYLPPNEQSSVYAEEGTVAHELHALCASMCLPAREFIGSTIHVPDLGRDAVIDAEMGEEVDRALEFLNGLRTPGDMMWVETKVSMDSFMKGQKGTADIMILSADWSTLTVLDLKYGAGHLVTPYRNGQLSLYALGAIDQLTYEQKRALKTVRIVVSQPRKNNFEIWDTTRGEMEKFRLEASARFHQATNTVDRYSEGNRVFVAGQHCWFCPRLPRCKHLKDKMLSVTVDDPQAPAFDAFKSPDTMSDDDLAEVFPLLSFIGAWANNTRKYMGEQALKGARTFKGLKLVEGKKGARNWIDEHRAEMYMIKKGLGEDQRHNHVLLSPSQTEKAIGRKLLDDEFKTLYRQPDGKPSLAEDSDPRRNLEELRDAAFDDFDLPGGVVNNDTFNDF